MRPHLLFDAAADIGKVKRLERAKALAAAGRQDEVVERAEALEELVDLMIEFFHGYTYSGNPIACAAALGTLDTYKEEGLLTRGEELAPYWEDALHSLKGEPHVREVLRSID